MDPQQDVIELPDKHPLRIRAQQAEAEVVTLRKQVATFESICAVCPSCGGMGFTTHDILRGGTEHDTEERSCTACAELGWIPKEVVTIRAQLAASVPLAELEALSQRERGISNNLQYGHDGRMRAEYCADKIDTLIATHRPKEPK